jgi:protein-histidine pros-kinase
VKLLAKFNLVLVVVFGLGMALISYFANGFLMDDARKQVLEQARLMANSAQATLAYTDEEVSPVLENTPQHNSDFLAQTIPFYAANTTFKRLHAAPSYQNYVIREAALNPTNPEDRAVDWEADLITYFRNHPGEKEVDRERLAATGQILYYATPIVAQAGCLSCHSEASAAPKAMVKHYGRNNGFGWKANDVVGVQVVSVPTSVAIEMAREGFRNLLISLGAIFLLTIVLIDLAMYLIVIRPLRRVSKNADIISKGELDLPPLQVKGKDEIAEVTASFNRMHTSLVKAFEMLNS